MRKVVLGNLIGVATAASAIVLFAAPASSKSDEPPVHVIHSHSYDDFVWTKACAGPNGVYMYNRSLVVLPEDRTCTGAPAPKQLDPNG